MLSMKSQMNFDMNKSHFFYKVDACAEFIDGVLDEMTNRFIYYTDAGKKVQKTIVKMNGNVYVPYKGHMRMVRELDEMV
jgi:hypothetical protein